MTIKSPKFAIKHTFPGVRPNQLRKGLLQNLDFSHHDLRTDFEGFMKYALGISAVFEKVHSGKPKSYKSEMDSPEAKQFERHLGASLRKTGFKTERWRTHTIYRQLRAYFQSVKGIKVLLRCRSKLSTLLMRKKQHHKNTTIIKFRDE